MINESYKITDLYCQLYENYIEAKLTLKIVIKYYAFGVKENWNAMNETNCMDFLILGRLKRYLLLQTACFFDKNSKSVTFDCVLEKLGDKGKNINDEFHAIQREFSDFLNNIRNIRNKVIAHNDDQHTQLVPSKQYDIDNVPNETFVAIYKRLDILMNALIRIVPNSDQIRVEKFDFDPRIDFWFHLKRKSLQ